LYNTDTLSTASYKVIVCCSGPSGAGSRGVTPVYLRCAQGRIEWKHPRGALRVLLRLPPSTSRHLPFRACVRPLEASGGSRIWLEERARLRPLFPEVLVRRERRGGRTECTTSRNGQVALFVEAEGADKDLTFAYHLQALPRSGHYDPSEGTSRNLLSFNYNCNTIQFSRILYDY
jgi:hypothetical protein